MKIKKYIFIFFLFIYAHAGAQNFIDKYLVDSLTYTTIGSAAQGIDQPRDLDFKPFTNELWVVNKATSAGGTNVIFYNAGQPNQSSEYRMDSHTGHFMVYPSAFAFSDNGYWASTGEIQNTSGPTSTFMGPSLWSGDTAIFARVFQSNWASGYPLGSHLDMLHQSPFAMGIAHDSLNVYWVFDGHNGNLCKYDFGQNHGPGYEDHSDGRIWRYTDISLQREVNVPSHMVKNKATGWLYIVETATKKLWRVNTTTGTFAGNLNTPPTGSETLSGYYAMTGMVKQLVDSFPTRPSGVDLYNGRMIVSDYDNGNIYVYDITVTPHVRLGTIVTGQPGIEGVKIGTDGKIWFVNNTQNTVVRISPSAAVTDAEILEITSPSANDYDANFYSTSFNTCAASINSQAILYNRGSATLVSVVLQCYIDGVFVNGDIWTGSLAPGSSTTVTLPSINLSSGNHKISIRTLTPNGTADENPANDRKDASFRIKNPVNTLPFTETFSVSTFPPAGWSQINYNPNNKMTRVPNVGGFGSNTGCLKMDNWSGVENITGQIDYMILPRIDLSTSLPTSLMFNVAYAQMNSSTNDSLKVLISTDCGTTWTQLYAKGGAILSTAAPLNSAAFIPNSNQWRNDTISLAAYSGENDVLIMFKTTSSYGNNLYIDNITIPNIPTLIEENSSEFVSVYPNPSTGIFNIVYSNEVRGEVEISVLNILGEQVIPDEKIYASGKIILDLGSLNNGNYFLRVKSENKIAYRKIVIVK
jgi:hypothetical protein